MTWNSFYQKLSGVLLRLSFAGVLALLVLLLSVLVKLIGRLDDLAPAELRLLLQVMKNRFLQ